MAYSVAVNQGPLTLMQTVKFILMALLFSCLLTACGLRGPLYLPEDEPAAKPDTAQTAESEENEEEQEKEEDSGS